MPYATLARMSDTERDAIARRADAIFSRLESGDL
jgi:hypothetical protein